MKRMNEHKYSIANVTDNSNILLLLEFWGDKSEYFLVIEYRIQSPTHTFLETSEYYYLKLNI